MNLKNSLFNNILKVLASNFGVMIISFLCSFIFPKIMTIDDYALYQTFILYINYVSILHLGFPTGMVINYAGEEYDTLNKKQYKSEILLLIIILIFFTCCSLLLYLIVRNKMVLFITFSIIPVCIIGSFKSLFQAWSKFQLYNRINMAISIVVPVIILIYYFIERNLPGEIYVISYLIVHWSITVWIFRETGKTLKNEKANKLFSSYNWKTEKEGFILLLGNYINVLFISCDKQFIKLFFSNMEFAYYSFGMSMQALMTVFITSIAQPLFPSMAQGKFSSDEYNKIKELLFILGSFSGCAYFAASIIVKLFIKKYTGSLSIISIYFVVFPAMAVINCLYINLYKIRKMMKVYIITLSLIFITSIGLNYSAIKFLNEFTGVAIATTLTYYIWLFIGSLQFDFIKIGIKDCIYLVLYILIYFYITNNFNDVIGFILYFISISVLAMICYGNRIKKYLYHYILKSN